MSAQEPLLSVSIADGCISEASLRERVEHYREHAAGNAGLRVHVEKRDEVLGFEVLREGSVVARRKFPQLSAACDEQRDTLALAIAVALASSAQDPEPAPAAGELVDDAVDADEPPLTAASGPRVGDVGVAAGVRYSLELLPDPLLLFDAGVDVGLARLLSLQAGGIASPVTESAADGGRMLAQVAGGELLLCARPVLANILFRMCGGAAAASVAVRGADFLMDRNVRLAWLAGLLRAAVRWPADSRVAGELVLGGHANLIRPQLQVLGSVEPDRVSWLVGGSLGIQLVVALR